MPRSLLLCSSGSDRVGPGRGRRQVPAVRHSPLLAAEDPPPYPGLLVILAARNSALRAGTGVASKLTRRPGMQPDRLSRWCRTRRPVGRASTVSAGAVRPSSRGGAAPALPAEEWTSSLAGGPGFDPRASQAPAALSTSDEAPAMTSRRLPAPGGSAPGRLASAGSSRPFRSNSPPPNNRGRTIPWFPQPSKGVFAIATNPRPMGPGPRLGESSPPPYDA